MKSLPTFFALLLLASCNGSDNIFDGRFRQAPEVGITDIACERLEMEIPDAARIDVHDTILVAYTPMSDRWHFTLFNLKDRSVIGHAIAMGNGPGEAPPFMLTVAGPLQPEDDGLKLWVAINGRHSLERIHLTSSISEGRTVVEQKIDLSTLDRETNSWSLCGDRFTNYRYDRAQGCCILSLLDPTSGTIVSEQALFRITSQDPSIFSAASCNRRDGTARVMGMLYFDQLCFTPVSEGVIDPSQSFSVSVASTPLTQDEVETRLPMQRELYYRRAVDAGEAVVLSYGGTENTELHIFDWQGTLLHRLRLDCRVPYFASGVLYGLTPEQRLVRTDLKKWLHAE